MRPGLPYSTCRSDLSWALSLSCRPNHPAKFQPCDRPSFHRHNVCRLWLFAPCTSTQLLFPARSFDTFPPVFLPLLGRPSSHHGLHDGFAQADREGDAATDDGAVSLKAPLHQLSLTSRVSDMDLKCSVPGISAVPHDDNLRYFDVEIHGPSGSPYEGEFATAISQQEYRELLLTTGA